MLTAHGKRGLYLTRVRRKPIQSSIQILKSHPQIRLYSIAKSSFINSRCNWSRVRSIPFKFHKIKFRGKVKAEFKRKKSIQGLVRKSCESAQSSLVSCSAIENGKGGSDKGDGSKKKKREGGVRVVYRMFKLSVCAPSTPKSTRSRGVGLRLAIGVRVIGMGKNQKRESGVAAVRRKKWRISSKVREFPFQLEVKGEGEVTPLSDGGYGGTRFFTRVVRSWEKRLNRCMSSLHFLAYLNSSSLSIPTRTFPLFSVWLLGFKCDWVYECISVFYLVGNTNLFFIVNLLSVMNLDKSSSKETCSSVANATKGKASSSFEQNVGPKTQCIPHMETTNLSEKIETEKGQTQVNVESLDAQLDNIRIESSKTKSKSLMGYVFGDPIDFKTMKFKLLSTWRLIRGEVQIYDRGHGWFECVFREMHHIQKIWGGRPYHVKGQLLLLKPWRVDFNTKLENTNVLDLWIKIFNLPPPLACNYGVRLVLEENGVGKFIKFDRASGGFFARACVNIDIIKNVPGQVRMSDNKDNPLLLVWFEDFPHGCGNCGELSHVYKNCPLKKHIPNKISINIIRDNTNSHPPSQEVLIPVSESEKEKEKGEGWTEVVGKKKKVVSSGGSLHGVKPYIEGGQGVSISFICKEDTLPTQNVGTNEGDLMKKKGLSKKVDVEEPLMVNDEMECEVAQDVLPVAERGSIDGALGEVESMLEDDDLLEEDLVAMEKQKMFIVELENEILADAVESSASGQLYSPNNDDHEPSLQAEAVSMQSKSDSLKRKGNEEGNEDTASSSMKRKKISGFL